MSNMIIHHKSVWIFFIVGLLFLIAIPAAAGTIEKGIELYQYNKMAEATPYLEKALRENPDDIRLYKYLGTAYEILGQYDKAIGFMKSAIDRQLGDKSILLFNIANNLEKKGDHIEATRYFGLALEEKPDFSEAVFQRAGSWLKLKEWQKSIDDYENFMVLSPDNKLNPDVRRMIAAIKAEMDAQVLAAKLEEERKIAEEKRKKEAEEARLAAEQKRLQDEAARKLAEENRLKEEEQKRLIAEELRRKQEAERKKLLDDIFNNLNSATSEQTDKSAGTEGIKNKQEDLIREE